MLVLSRKVGQRILLPSCNAVITVTAVRGHNVTLGITAPRDVQVYREELCGRLPEKVERAIVAMASAD